MIKFNQILLYFNDFLIRITEVDKSWSTDVAMKEGINIPRYIVADDFTGANDIGVALASSGIVTQVLLTDESSHDNNSSVGVICTNSRDLASNEAKDKLANTSINLQLAQKQPLLIKKVDSTLRGNIGSEIQALLATGYALSIVAIAAPYAKRKTVGGLCYVNDVPLSETEFASDPKSPIRSSRIKDIIELQTNAATVEYLLADANSEQHEQNFAQLYDSGAKIIVCDAQSHTDLFDLYHAASQLNVPTVFVTTGELTYSLVAQESSPLTELRRNPAPVLAVIGSMSEMTLKQSQYLLDNKDAEVIDLELEELLSPDWTSYLETKSDQAIEVLKQGSNCVVRSCKNAELRHELKAIAEQHGLSQKQLAEHVRECLASFASQIIRTSNAYIGGMILCGGDIAIATAQHLGASSYQIGGRVAGCVPWGTLNSTFTPFPIFTKAGGFGEPATFSQVIQQLHKEVRQ